MRPFRIPPRSAAFACLVALLAVGGSIPAMAEENPLVASVRAELADPAAPFTMLVRFTVLPGKEAAFVEAMAEPLAETVKEPGNVAYALGRSAKDPSRFVLFERWKSLDDLEKHLGLPYLVRLAGAFPGLLAGPPEIEVLTPIGS